MLIVTLLQNVIQILLNSDLFKQRSSDPEQDTVHGCAAPHAADRQLGAADLTGQEQCAAHLPELDSALQLPRAKKQRRERHKLHPTALTALRHFEF